MANSIIPISHEQTLQTIMHSNQSVRDLVQVGVNDFLSLYEEIVRNSDIEDLPVFKNVLLPLLEEKRIERLKVCVTSNKVQLAFCGENSSGKSAFLHAFLGIGKILPSGDGPITARITKLTYATKDQACICIRKTLQDQTPSEPGVDLSELFVGAKPDWPSIALELAKHLRRPQDMDEKSTEFGEWARCFVEIRIPSPTLALGIDVYDTPGFLLDDAPILKEILHDLVELVHPTIVFMYANPSTDDATRGCFLAIKTALRDLDVTSIFFLNSKADVSKMPKLKKNMKEAEFISVLASERAQRYELLLRAPFLSNDRLEGLPESINECACFDVCSSNSQSIKPYGPLMNETAIQRIIQFVANNDLTVATDICKTILPIIDGFFHLFVLMAGRTAEQLRQLQFDALNWEKAYFRTYKILTEKCLEDLFLEIFKRFISEEETIIRLFLPVFENSTSIGSMVQTAVRLEIITPAVRTTLRSFMHEVLNHIAANNELACDSLYNDILMGALNRQEISDFAASLLDGSSIEKRISACMLYMVNTISTPFIQCAQNLQSLTFLNRAIDEVSLSGIDAQMTSRIGNHRSNISTAIRELLLTMQTITENQRGTMLQAMRLWGDKQQAILRSLVDAHYEKASPILNSHQQTLTYLKEKTERFIIIECELCAAQDILKLNARTPEICCGASRSTVFSSFTINWGDESRLTAKKLNSLVCEQPNAAYYEAHYHRKVAKLRHPNVVDLRYLYKHHLDDNSSELWMIFPPIASTLDRFLEQPSTSLSIVMVLRWLTDITSVLMAYHRNELVHRNISLSNIVVTENGHALLLDLGNWYADCDLSVRHDPSSTRDGTNDDIKALGEVSRELNTFINNDEKVSAITDEFRELYLKCLQASCEKPVTAQFVHEKLTFLLDMF